MVIPVKHFYMIRHGETEANAARIMAGSIDSPLNENGIAQAHGAQKIIENLNIRPSHIVHSNLSRARDTAHILNKNLTLPVAENADLAEIHVGIWEGQSYDVCQDMLKGWVDVQNGEPYLDFFARIKRAKIHCLEHYETPLIVSHGGVFRAFFELYGIQMQGVHNCTLYEFYPCEITNGAFPWKVFRHDEENAHQICLQFSDPASEILR